MDRTYFIDNNIFIPDYIVVTLDTKDHFVMAVTSDDMENIPSMMVGQKYNFWLKLKTEKTNFFDTTDYYGLPIYESLKIEGDSL